jgi:general stress protein YciG
MADESNTRGDFMDERSGPSGSGRGGIGEGRDSGERGGNSDGIGREGNTGSGAVRKTPRGFAAMDPQAQRAIAAKGGRAAHQKGTAHEFTSEEARIAGRKGGEASRGGRRSNGNNSNS